MRTNDLKKLIMSKLKIVASNVYYQLADEDALYPHVVFSFRNVDLGDLSRQDYVLSIDVWDKRQTTTQIDDLTDTIENMWQGQNLPQDNILPTFYLISRKDGLPDEDKTIKHNLIEIQVQNYER